MKPTVYVDSIRWLRWRRALEHRLGTRRLRGLLGAVGVVAGVLGGLGAFHAVGAHEDDARASGGTACEDERGPVAG
ncbi:MAG TPA: hypothetical protein VD793_10895 [Gemmatimonadales bacterium]|nr:hypothetical protein [Gemmatimonadales bacterium]